MTERAERIPLLLPTVTALAGALLGWALLFRERPVGTTLAVLGGSVAVGVLFAALLVGQAARPRPPEQEDQGRAAEPPRPRPTAPSTDSRASRPGADHTGPRAAQLVLPVGAGGAPTARRPGQWWDRDTSAPAPAAGAGAGSGAIESARPTPRDLAELRDSARVVQCPRCGAFRLDARHTGTGYAFRCHVDGHEWSWRPGTAWPVTVVASRRRRAP